MKKLFIGLSIFAVSLSVYSEADLEKKLDSLNIPTDRVTPLVSKGQISSVNSRYSSLNKRVELTLIGANNFTADSHMDTKLVGATMRLHLNSRFSFGGRYSEYLNELTDSGQRLFETKQILPDTDYAIKSSEGFLNINTVYGKFRLTKSKIVYFDHFVSLGYGKMALANGEVQMYTADTGFSFWFGKNASARVGVKNEFYDQAKLNGKEAVHSAMGYLEIGYLFGGTKI